MKFAITDTKLKEKRLKEVDDFVVKYGRGDLGLTEEHKKNRIAKYLSDEIEIEKVHGHGKNPDKGIKFLDKSIKARIRFEDHVGPVDNIPAEVLQNIQSYPKDIRYPDGKKQIVYMHVRNNGEMHIEHLILDGKENNVAERSYSGTCIYDDVTASNMEYQQFQEGKLTEVSDRTMVIHKDKGRVHELLEHPDVDTDPDKPGQI